MGDELNRPTGRLVECHSGYAYAERPMAVFWQGERLEIEQVLRKWRAPGGYNFRVRAQDARIFELYYDELLDEWRVSTI